MLLVSLNSEELSIDRETIEAEAQELVLGLGRGRFGCCHGRRLASVGVMPGLLDHAVDRPGDPCGQFNNGGTMPNTVRLHRVLATTPEKVYRAFLEADALAKWLPPNGFACTVSHLEPKVGGTFKMSFRNFTTGKSHAFGGEYVELVPGERLRYTDKFDDPNLPGEMTTTITLKKVSVGAELSIVQEGIPDMIPPEACCLGWQESLALLAKLVEAEIPD